MTAKHKIQMPKFLSILACYLLWDILYTVNMYYSHWLIIELIWPIARQNKARWESQTENTERKKSGVRER